MKKVLVVELWGLGDAVIMSCIIQPLLDSGRDVAILCKADTARLLKPSLPRARFLVFYAPWTVFRGKYRIWKWRWNEILKLLRTLYRERFDEAVSVRADPRDHFLMLLAGVKTRCGFPIKGSGIFLNVPVIKSPSLTHRVEDWHLLVERLVGKKLEPHKPTIELERYSSEVDSELKTKDRSVFLLHCGAGQPVRRWPVSYYREIFDELRGNFDFQLAVIPDEDGYGNEMKPCADFWFEDLTIEGLVNVLGTASLFFGNDSGPGHIAAALGIPVVALFGPQQQECFAPYGDAVLPISRDLCQYRPCRDYCRFSEPYCLTRLVPSDVIWEIVSFIEMLIEKGKLPESVSMKGETA